MFDPARADLVLGIVGIGAMGRGIAQIAATSGAEVRFVDARPGAAEEARAAIAAILDGLAAKGRMDRAAATAAAARLKPVAGLADLSDAHVVVEAIVEDLEAKRALFAELEKAVGPDCILATNTSSLAVAAIAAACARPGRVAGFHFFNPVPLMRIVEVIGGALTEPWVTDALTGLARRFGHRPVRAADLPGFLVNHAGRGLTTEALRLLHEGVAGVEDADRILREACGFRMGPFEFLDLTGLDVSLPVMETIYRQFYDEPRFRPSVLLGRRLAAGLLGRKSGRGFYTYRDGRPVAGAEPPAPVAAPRPVWIAAEEDGWRKALADLAMHAGWTVDAGAQAGPGSLCLVAPLGRDATETALEHGLDPRRTVAVDLLPGLAARRTLMTTPLTEPAWKDAAHALLAADGTPVTTIRDSHGFVAQRVLATIVNIACDMAQQRIATPDDIDAAVRLGLGYPQGPLAWGDALGPMRVLGILERILAGTGDPRYRPSPWLARRARLGVSLLTPEP
ncbi:3-hydroxyacyl-CoA dehydrogenase [Arenibaculum pallidiluteum]|uniref:3-hydroxyacyl-CoA dehydrogenase n=1 Tax=Arenibaculum pallidiluteum TaxID=2812559 RepID=UPI001A97A7F5|nr:3-hydroxyacyl-CoA dehydrogenase [Arenibaculum pallidiluteum]